MNIDLPIITMNIDLPKLLIDSREDGLCRPSDRLSISPSSGRRARKGKLSFIDWDGQSKEEILIERSFNKSYFGELTKERSSYSRHKSRSPAKKKQFLKQSFESQILTEINSHHTDQKSGLTKRSKQSTMTLIVQKLDDLEGISPTSCCSFNSFEDEKYQCTLSSNELSMKQNEHWLNSNNSFFINFDAIWCSIETMPFQLWGKIKQSYLKLKVGKNTTFIISQPNNSQNRITFQSWSRALQKAIRHSLGVKYQLLQLQEIPRFYQDQYKTERQFYNCCQTGDILLFEGQGLANKVQRFVTNSDFDHVAFVVRDPVYGVLMYESTGRTGVNLTPWKVLVQYSWYKLVKRIVWRRLENVERTQEFHNLIQSFVRANVRAKYHISLDKLLNGESMIQSSQGGGYFCSELVARVYKLLDLLPSEKEKYHPDYRPAHKYYPSHFCQRHALKLKKGSLSSENEIVFCQRAIQEDYDM